MSEAQVRSEAKGNDGMNVKDIVAIVITLAVGLGVFMTTKPEGNGSWSFVIFGVAVIGLVMLGALGQNDKAK
ncbi:hypothetical protein [Ferrimonas marina]|uniref:Uncharacterized protein n=1 Tax=Ferrimonas marina TaxID=299255 RepID=A0A1M5NZA8_9GAMM|nr:hypothetical protein [Ferrimonas marina]SHG94906.1 hypothetical protein SAMN02745129_1234 [Ferrimonas marina]